ncbi:MAG: hypothetical protein WAV89_14675 [Ignavibacteriaceae bacterium]
MESLLSKRPKINSKIIAGLLTGLIGISLIFGSDWKDLFNTKYLLGVLSIFGAVVIILGVVLVKQESKKVSSPAK